jgi:hypothetical protein
VLDMPTLEEHIAARLHRALDHHEGARIDVFTAQRGPAVGRPDVPIIVLTAEDVARIAAGAVRLKA